MTKAKFVERLGAELGIPPAKLLEETTLNSVNEFDSTRHMAVLAMIDTELGYEVPPCGLQKCKTVGDLVAMVGSKLEA
jgi:acyl carrier protein